MSTLPLQGLRVVALEQAVAAPFCSRQLADMGADVIKVERPNGGDFARSYDGALHGLSAYFAWLNRGKRSIVLDPKRTEDRDVCSELIACADIFIHNLAPGSVERLGFGYDTLFSVHPQLIWCGISGYGPDGPYRDKKAYDLLIQAESGIVGVTGLPDAPAKVGVSIADIAAGLYGYSSILTALLNRERTEHGERIDISMLECMTEWMMPPISVWQGTGRIPARVGMRHNMIVPYGAYRCADGLVNFAIQNAREWSRFCDLVLQLPSLVHDERFASNEKRLESRAELETVIEQQFASLMVSEVIARLNHADIANSAVNDVQAVTNHVQLTARGRWMNIPSPNGMIPALLPPHNLKGVLPHMGSVPVLGEHTEQILAELAKRAAEKGCR